VAAAPSFTLGAAPASLSVTQGTSGTSTITVTPLNGFTGAASLATAGLPTGVTATFSPASISSTSTLTLAASASASIGTATVTITATSGNISAKATLALTVAAAPSFKLGAAPASLSMTQGTSGSSTITVTPLNGFTGAASLAIGGLPTGVTATFSPASISSTSTLTLTASASASIGTATVTITATSGSISAKAALALTVAAPSFTLASSVANVNVAAGSAGTATISVAPQGSFGGTVALTAAGLPAGVTASFSPASTNATSTLTLTAASSTAPKASQFTLKGTSGSLTATLTITVTVTPAPDFALTLAPGSLSVVEGATGTSAISITATNGFTGNVALSASALPSGVTASFSALGNSGLLLGTFVAAGSAVAGTSQVTVTATSGSLSHSAVLKLTVVAPSAGTASVNLSPYYNVSGSAVDYLPFTGGGLDAGGRSYSGLLLGASQSVGGTVFSLGPMGVSDAVSGQTVKLPAGQFTTLKLLATGANGNQPGQVFTVTYTDGTTASFTQSLSDWCTPQSYSGESKAVPMTYRDNSTGTIDSRTLYLYGYSFSLNSAKTVSTITLPQNRNVVVLAITLMGGANVSVMAQVDLSKAFNGIGITSDGKPFTGGLDGVGYAYSGSLLQGAPTFNNVQFRTGAADSPNVVSGASAAIALPGGQYSSLLILATAVNGAQLSQPFKVVYSDGSSVTFTQSLSDWFIPANYSGELNALAMPYRNAANGTKDNRTFALYEYTFNLNNGKTVSSIALPADSNVKVFAITLNP
jgi:hypothetical protein